MNTAQRILKNTGASIVYQIANPAASFVLVFFIARYLGVSGMGKFSSALSLYFMFQAFAALGFPYLVTKEVAQDKTKASQFLINGSLVGLVSSAVMSGIMCLSVNFITESKDITQGVYILSISLIPYTLAVVCQSINKAFEKMEHVAASEISGNFLKMLFGVFLLMKGYGILELTLVILGTQTLTFALSLHFALKCIRKPLRHIVKEMNLDFSRWIVRASPVFALILIVSAVRLNIDITILTKMMGEIEVGYYSAASKLVTLCKQGITCYIMAVQPVVFRLYMSSSERFEKICQESIRYIFIIIFPIIFGTMILSEHFIVLIFKQAFLPSALALSVLIWTTILFGLNQIFANALIAGHKQNVNLHANLIGMFGNIGLNLVLIPWYGFLGAAVANVASAFMVLVYQSVFVSKYLFKTNYVSYVQKPLLSSLIMGGILILLRDRSLLVSIPISALIYFASLLALKTFSSNDRDLIRKLFRVETELARKGF